MRRTAWSVAGAILGAVPGLILVLIAQFVVRGEPQLTVGVAGIWLAIVGAVVGLSVALVRTRGRRPAG